MLSYFFNIFNSPSQSTPPRVGSARLLFLLQDLLHLHHLGHKPSHCSLLSNTWPLSEGWSKWVVIGSELSRRNLCYQEYYKLHRPKEPRLKLPPGKKLLKTIDEVKAQAPECKSNSLLSMWSICSKQSITLEQKVTSTECPCDHISNISYEIFDIF